ncbi:hypothetical protein C1646_278135 [Rhizophagus diaphanus]|nr:hypothetical protein C1646_278135 [Rhizophagus diaphanus] [Rhizophagus sp. MUCL 43196]
MTSSNTIEIFFPESECTTSVYDDFYESEVDDDKYYETDIKPVLPSKDTIDVVTNVNTQYTKPLITKPLVNIFSHTNKEFSFLISFEKFHVTKSHRTGFNKIYKFRCSKSFFFEIVDQLPDTNEIHLKIYTNDYHMSSTPIRYCSTSRLPNCRFQISKCLTHFFSSQRVIPKRIQDKYFNMLRKKLLDRITFIKSRGQNKSQHNHMTKTFFNFSYKKYRFHFGIYKACSHPAHTLRGINISPLCTVPSPFIITNEHKACIDHFNKLAFYHTICQEILKI